MTTDDRADTIVAIATPPGRGGIGVVRVSGARVRAIARALLGDLPAPRHASLRSFKDEHGDPIDAGLALFFPAPHSFTGEDVLELHGHGGPVVLDLLLQRVVALGARLAQPGEFSRRAFLNDKLDLAQAEAVADLIESSSAQAARAAMRSLQGEFSQRVHALVAALIDLRMYVEAAIDFPEEEIDFLSEGVVAERLDRIVEQLADIRHAAQQGSLLREGMHVVIAGRPNAGKSSLLNRLAGYEVAIVTEIPGTTRDVLRERILIDGMPLHVVDTAGLRESADRVEQEGVRRAWDEIARADRVLMVIDDRLGWQDSDEALLARLPEGLPVTRVRNKIDLTGAPAGVDEGANIPEVRLSAHTGAGLEALRAHLKACMGFEGHPEGAFLARRRHLTAIEQADARLAAGKRALHELRAGELLAEELRLAQQALAEITGAFSTDDLLERIFSSFCIGK